MNHPQYPSLSIQHEITNYNIGIAYLDIGDYKKAREHLEQCISLNPESSGGYYGLGEIERIEGNPQQAMIYYKKAYGFGQDGASIFYGLAELPINFNPNRQSHFLKAVYQTELENIVKHYPDAFLLSLDFDMPMITYRYGKILFENEFPSLLIDYKDAFEKANRQTDPFRKLIKIWRMENKKPVKDLLAEAIIYFYLGDPVSAYLVLTQDILGKELPLNAMGWHYLMLCSNTIMEENNFLRQKATDFAFAILQAPVRVSARDSYYTALILYLNGHIDQAISTLETTTSQLQAGIYALAEIYQLQYAAPSLDPEKRKEYEQKYTALQICIHVLPMKGDLPFTLGIQSIGIKWDDMDFIRDIQNLLYFLELRHIIAKTIHGPLELQQEFFRTISLFADDPQTMSFHLAVDTHGRRSNTCSATCRQTM